MLRFALREAARLALGLLGAVLVASAIAALAQPAAWHATWPFFTSAVAWILGILRLSFGYSAISGLPVAQEFGERLPATAPLIGVGAAFAILLGAPLGAIFSLGATRRAAGLFIQAVTATPLFCAGLALAWVAQHVLHWSVLVASGTSLAPGNDVLLPALITVGAAGAGCTQLLIRRGVAATIGEPYRAGLKRLGLSAFEIERVYVAPQILAALFLGLGELSLVLLAAAAVSEWVFGLHGAADLFVKSVALGDWNMVAFVFLIFAASTMVASACGRVGAHALTGLEQSS